MTNPENLPDDIDALKAIVLRQQDQNARLEKLVADFKRALFGVKSEKVDPGQYELAFEVIETAIETIHAERDADVVLRPGKPRKSNRGHLPKHLPRIEEVIEPEDIQCSCGAERHIIGEDTSERLDIIPAQFRVIVTRRPKYACRSCEAGIVQAQAKPRLIEGGMPTEATVASVIVSKYTDHLPLYRQAQIYVRQGVDLDRSTLASWVSAAPIAQEGLKQIAALYRIEADIKGQPADARLVARIERTKPKLEVFEKWLTQSRTQVSAKSPTGEALKYITKYWNGLNLFLTDGRIEIDNNSVERTIRPIALNRKNALFAGHEAGAQNWAMPASLIETCKLNAVEPHAYITGILTAIVNGHKQSRIDELLPWNYTG